MFNQYNNTEEFLPIKGFEELYIISVFGMESINNMYKILY